MKKNDFDMIDTQLKLDFGQDSDEYRVLSNFFLSNKLNKYLKLLQILHKGSQEEIEDEFQNKLGDKGRFSLRNFQTQFGKQQFLNQMMQLKTNMAQQERSILFDMLESILKQKEFKKAQKLLDKHKYHLDINGQHLAEIFIDFIDKTQKMEQQKNKQNQKISSFQYRLEIKTIALKHELQRKDKIIHDQVYDFQSLFKDLQNHNIQIKFKQFNNIVRQQNKAGQLLIHQAIHEDNLELVKYMAVNYPDQANELTQHNERPYILSYKLKQYDIFNYFLQVPNLMRDQDYYIDEINKRQGIIEYGDNSLFEYSIKHKLDNMRRYFLWKLESKRIKLTEDSLLEVCEYGHLDQVCYLVEHIEDDVNRYTTRGDSPLLIACSRGRFDIVEYLIRVGKANVNHSNRRGDTALLIASDKAHFKIIKYLIENTDVDSDQHNKLGDTALLISSQKGEMRTVMYLIEEALVKFNQTNKNGDSALLKASYWNRIEVIRYLVEEKSVSLYQTNNNGYTCLLIAAKWGFLDIISYLVEERNIRLDQKIKNGDNALIIAADKGHLNIVKYLLEKGQMDRNYSNNNGDTALLRASYRGDLDMIQYLIELRKVDCNQKNFDGDTPLLIASKQGHYQIIRYLLEKQNIDQEQENNQGDTILLIACQNGYLDIIKYLIQARQVNIKKRNKNRDTALLLACQEGRMEIIEYLILEAQVDVNVKNNNNENVQMFAEKWGYSHLLRKRQSLLYLKEL